MENEKETQNLINFLDGVIEAAYQARCFQKEAVSQSLIMTQMIKEKLKQADELKLENSARSITIENLENKVKSLEERFESLGIDLEELNKKIDVNEIDVPENSVEEISNHSQNGSLKHEKISKAKKLN